MNPLILTALTWLLEQPDYCIERTGIKTRVAVGRFSCSWLSADDAVIEAYEVCYVEPALREARKGEPT